MLSSTTTTKVADVRITTYDTDDAIFDRAFSSAEITSVADRFEVTITSPETHDTRTITAASLDEAFLSAVDRLAERDAVYGVSFTAPDERCVSISAPSALRSEHVLAAVDEFTGRL